MHPQYSVHVSARPMCIPMYNPPEEYVAIQDDIQAHVGWRQAVLVLAHIWWVLCVTVLHSHFFSSKSVWFDRIVLQQIKTFSNHSQIDQL